MGFTKFLVQVTKMGLGMVGGLVIFMSGWFAMVESTAIGTGMLLVGAVIGLYGIYSLIELQNGSYRDSQLR